MMMDPTLPSCYTTPLLAGFEILLRVYRTRGQVCFEDCTDIVSIIYDPDNPFTAAEQELLMELLAPEVRVADSHI